MIDWHWHYHFPGLAAWSLLVALLVLMRSNHRLQAWLILLPVAAVALGWSMLARLFFLPVQVAVGFGDFLLALATAWAAAWLMAGWLADRRAIAALVLALGAMLVTCGAFYFGVYGAGGGRDFEVAAAWIVFQAVGVVSLLSATALGAFGCRSRYRPGIFMAWCLLGMLVVSIVTSVPAMALLMLATFPGELSDLPWVLVPGIIFSVIGGALAGVMLYVLNLPFMFLAVRSPFYRDRFQRVLRLVPAERAWQADGSAPACEAVLATLVEESAP